MFTEWVVRTLAGKPCCGPIAMSRSSPMVPVGRQISSEAEPSPAPPRAPHDVTLHGMPLAGRGGTAKDGAAGSVALGAGVRLRAAPRVGRVAAAPLVPVSAEAEGTSHRAANIPIVP